MSALLALFSALLCMQTARTVPMQFYEYAAGAQGYGEIMADPADPILGALTLAPGHTTQLKGASYISANNCYDIWVQSDFKAKSGIYTVQPRTHATDTDSFVVFCDMDLLGGGWTVILRRVNGEGVPFEQPWIQYRNGFGDLFYNFWLGLEKMRRLTKSANMELYIGLQRDGSGDSQKACAKYKVFEVGAESDHYPLFVDQFDDLDGNCVAGDSLSSHFNQPFTTVDMDNDDSHVNCAKLYASGWWFKNCQESNLNGKYDGGILWPAWLTEHVSLKSAVMAIRPGGTD